MRNVRQALGALIALVAAGAYVWITWLIATDGGSGKPVGFLMITALAALTLGVARLVATDRASMALLLGVVLFAANAVFWLVTFFWLPVTLTALICAAVARLLERRELRLARQWRPA